MNTRGKDSDHELVECTKQLIKKCMHSTQPPKQLMYVGDIYKYFKIVLELLLAYKYVSMLI